MENKQYRLTLRQCEFCRFYAQGISASKAAHMAGYAKSTAEHNAARILENPLAQARIMRIRGQKLIRNSDALAIRDKALRMLDESTDYKAQVAAMKQLQQLNKQFIHPLDTTNYDEIATEIQTDVSNILASQKPDNQNETIFDISEINTLPDGRTAYDQTLERTKVPAPDLKSMAFWQQQVHQYYKQHYKLTEPPLVMPSDLATPYMPVSKPTKEEEDLYPDNY